jgi:hypothetical protein
MTTLRLFWMLCATALSSLALGAWWAYGVWVESRKANSRLDAIAATQEAISKEQRGLRQQMSNLLSMLLRAGFKRGRTLDWSDNERETQSLDESLSDSETRWFWRK